MRSGGVSQGEICIILVPINISRVGASDPCMTFTLRSLVSLRMRTRHIFNKHYMHLTLTLTAALSLSDISHGGCVL